mgnify:CR=1 FL=1
MARSSWLQKFPSCTAPSTQTKAYIGAAFLQALYQFCALGKINGSIGVAWAIQERNKGFAFLHIIDRLIFRRSSLSRVPPQKRVNSASVSAHASEVSGGSGKAHKSAGPKQSITAFTLSETSGYSPVLNSGMSPVRPSRREVFPPEDVPNAYTLSGSM